MQAVLIIEHRFKRGESGRIFASSNSVTPLLWQRYLTVFDSLKVIARIENVDYQVDEKYSVDCENVIFEAIPYYIGPKQFLIKYFSIKNVLENQIDPSKAYILRLPSIFGTLMIKKLRKNKIPYVVELVGDPWEVFAPGALKKTFSFLHRLRSYLTLKKNVAYAQGVIYVTESMLQSRYPAKRAKVTTHASNVLLRQEDIIGEPKIFMPVENQFSLLSIGSLEQLYKSPDIVLKAVKILIEKGYHPRLIWLGGGKYQCKMQELAKELGIESYVDFRGNVAFQEVEKELKNTDIYIHVSRTEGLPRAIIEAMAKGLPCIATRVGGIPELIEKDFLIEKNDVNALVDKIEYLMKHPEKANVQASINLKKSREFEFTLLEERRREIYKTLLR